MKPNLFRHLLAALAITLPVQGAAVAADPEPAVGKVLALYVRQSNGLYVDLRALPRARAPEFSDLWADVQFAGEAPNGRDFAIARLGKIRDVEIGDLVAVEFALEPARLPGVVRVAPVTASTRVILLAAKNHTIAAQEFGRKPELRPAVLVMPASPRPAVLRTAFAPAD